MYKNHELRALLDKLSLEDGSRYRQALELAIYDDLTRLYNRRYFMMRFQEEVQRGERSGTPFALLLMDIDDFKDVNDNFGHPVGDKVLQELAQLLLREVRTIDVVSRYGGEEFVIILTETDIETAKQVAQRLLTAARSPIYTAMKISITLSIGLAVFPKHGSHPDILLVQADNALYQAKLQGKNRLCIASTDISRANKYKSRKKFGQNDRVIIKSISVIRNERTVSVSVELVYNGITFISRTDGGEDKLLTLVAEAAIGATASLLPKSITIKLVDIQQIKIKEQMILTSFVSTHDSTDELLLIGAVLAGNDPATAAAKSVLDALNRYVTLKT